jgi:hypothetical protein
MKAVRRLLSRPISTIGTLIAPDRTQQEANQIVTEGLVGHWDAGNPYSYPGTGTTWTDLAGSSNATLINSPTFNSGQISFNGTNQSAEANHVSAFNLSSLTILVWARATTTTAGSYRPLVCKHRLDNLTNAANRDYQIYTYNSTAGNAVADRLHFSCGYRGAWDYTLPFVPPSGVWCQFGCWVNGSSLDSGALFNGVKSDNILTLNEALPQWTAPIRISQSDFTWGNAPISVVQIYNRVLSDSEVYQNYQSTRGRFGV